MSLCEEPLHRSVAGGCAAEGAAKDREDAIVRIQ